MDENNDNELIIKQITLYNKNNIKYKLIKIPREYQDLDIDWINELD